MSTIASRSRRAYRQRRAEDRVLIDGRLTCVCVDVIHGKPATYSNHSCRCEPCSKAHNHYVAVSREKRLRGRRKINGVMVAVMANEHGKSSTYSNWGCQCPPCMGAWREYQEWLNRRPGTR